jgi:anhydro-N-acetylmuramic acid kinase
MTGTSLDGVDAVLADFEQGEPRLIASRAHAMPDDLRERLVAIIDQPARVDLDHLGTAHRQLGVVCAEAVAALLSEAGHSAADIAAIGCHGQTVRHSPDGDLGFTLQIGDAATIATHTGIVTVSDFRSADIALGGQGAPLVPAFHRAAFGAPTPRVIVNIGGIANISVLAADGSVTGFDTGPGNTLLDDWCRRHREQPFDRAGEWGRTGSVLKPLLATLLDDPYFAAPPPKSTGREYFNSGWLGEHLARLDQPPAAGDVQATLTELTARSIAGAIAGRAPDAAVYVCGGGAGNLYLLERLGAALPETTVSTTADLGIDPDWVEAAAFAWLAQARLQGEPGNVPRVTGAAREAVLGAVHAP